MGCDSARSACDEVLAMMSFPGTALDPRRRQMAEEVVAATARVVTHVLEGDWYALPVAVAQRRSLLEHLLRVSQNGHFSSCVEALLQAVAESDAVVLRLHTQALQEYSLGSAELRH